jgi:hypothetical protein
VFPWEPINHIIAQTQVLKGPCQIEKTGERRSLEWINCPLDKANDRNHDFILKNGPIKAKSFKMTTPTAHGMDESATKLKFTMSHWDRHVVHLDDRFSAVSAQETLPIGG